MDESRGQRNDRRGGAALRGVAGTLAGAVAAVDRLAEASTAGADVGTWVATVVTGGAWGSLGAVVALAGGVFGLVEVARAAVRWARGRRGRSSRFGR